MVLTSFDPRTLSRQTQDLGDSRELFLLNEVFRGKNTHPTEAIQIGKLTADARLVTYNRLNEPATYVNKLQGSLETVVPPIIRPKKTLDRDFFASLNPGLSSYIGPHMDANVQAAEKVTLELNDLRRRIDRAKEVQCAQALSTGIVTITYKDGTTAYLSMGYTGDGTEDSEELTIQKTLDGTKAWGIKGSNPIQDIEDQITYSRRYSMYQGTYDVIMDRGAWKLYFNSPGVQALWTAFPSNLVLGTLTPSEKMAYKGEINGVRYFVYDGGYVNDDGDWTPTWPTNTIVTLPSDREWFTLEFGAIFEKMNPNDQYAGFIQTDIFAKMITTNEDPPVTDLIMQSNPLAIVRNPRCVRVRKVAPDATV